VAHLLLIPNLTHLFASARAEQGVMPFKLETASRLSPHHAAGRKHQWCWVEQGLFSDSASAAPTHVRSVLLPRTHVSCMDE
jgi:hypothetical protein